VPPEAAPARAAAGYSHVTPVVDMMLYQPFLERHVTVLGGRLAQMPKAGRV
jgi:hypothetical protein